jgi:UDP-GlcNAc:undecaprenyl-phosphate/decaprenyl-phosphate GlcNAc-1-phosphate transferase
MAVFGALLISLVIGWIADPFIRQVVIEHPAQLAALGMAATCIIIVGAIDDRHSLTPMTKLLVEIAAAVIVASAGYRIRSIRGVELRWLGGLATVAWIVAVTNAINMVDGLDGLAAGIGLIISASLFSTAIYFGGLTSAAILAALSGALLGFLFHNFHPAKIFLGDSGSLLTGFLLAVTAVESSNKAATAGAIFFPLLSLGLPLSELALTTLRRMLRVLRVVRLDASARRYEFSLIGEPALFTADREHIHHRLLAMGINYRKAVLGLYLVCLVLGVCSFLVVACDVTNFGLILLAFTIVSIAAKRLGYSELQPLSNGLFLPVFDLPGMNRAIVYVLSDLGFVAISCVGAWLIESNFQWSRAAALPILTVLPLLATVQMGGFYLARLYRRSYRYASIADLVPIGRSIGLAVSGGWLSLVAIGYWQQTGLSFVILDGYLLATLVLGSRISFKLLDHLFRAANQARMQRAAIYGAGVGGLAAVREMRSNPSLGMRPVAFLDDDTDKCGNVLEGITVQRTEELEEFINARKADVIVIASTEISHDRLKGVVHRCALAGIPLRVFSIAWDEMTRELDEVPRITATTRRIQA